MKRYPLVCTCRKFLEIKFFFPFPIITKLFLESMIKVDVLNDFQSHKVDHHLAIRRAGTINNEPMSTLIKIICLNYFKLT